MIDAFFNTLKKTLVLTVFVIFGLVATYIPHPTQQNIPEAEALFGLGDIVLDPSNLIQTTITAALQGGLVNKEYILDGIAWALAKSTISTMVGDMVNWVGNGFPDALGNFGGSSAFVQNLEQYMREVAFEENDRFLEYLGGSQSFLCTPFKLDIQTALTRAFSDLSAPPWSPSGTYDRPYSACNVEDEFEDFEAFIAGDFSSGGWDDWFKVVGNPEKYTEYGQLLEAQQLQQRNLLTAQENERQQLEFGNGFKSVKQCQNVSTPDGDRPDCRVVTPGTAIEDALNKVLGSGQDSLVQADELSEVIVSLLSQVAGSALTGSAGILGLASGTDYTYAGYDGGSYTSQLQSDAQQQAQGLQNNTDDFIRDASQAAEITATLALQQQLASAAETFITQLDSSGSASSYQAARSQATFVRTAAERNVATLEALLDSGTYTTFNADNYFTQQQVSVYISQWTEILDDIYN